MFRRRAPRSSVAEPAAPSAPRVSVAALASDGWLLPRGLPAVPDGRSPSWTLIGTVGSPTATPVDAGGLVVGEGWSLDWWIGADDRWHLPAREPAVRQGLVDEAPVVETLVRIPGGDAVARAYGIRAPRGTGDEWVVAEVENATPVPFAVALVVRPFVADGLGSVGEITIEPVEGGSGRDVAHLVRVDGRPAVVLPRRPSRAAVGSAASGDVLDVVIGGSAGEDLADVRCEAGLATAAFVFPLPHTAVLRAALPVGTVDAREAMAFPSVVPDAATVASGWEVHRRGPRFELPERRLQVAVERARAQIHLAHDGEAVHRDGGRTPALEPGATEVLLGALDLLDRPADVGAVVARWIDALADPRPEVDALFLDAVARHWRLHRVDALLDWMLPEVAAAVERLDRAHRRGQLADPAAHLRAARALRAAVDLLADSGQAEAAVAVAAVADRVAVGAPARLPAGTVADDLVEVAHQLVAGRPDALADLDRVLGELSPTGAWPGPGAGGRPVGHDLAAAAALVAVARNLLVVERAGGLALLPVFPDGWYGAGIELHDAPTAVGRLSYAIRWHGTRPALLWELEPHPGLGPVGITVPGLDPTWSTTEVRGDALLGEVAPPEGLELIREVAEHPDIDPAMRRPGQEPEPPAAPIPEGGTFS